MKALLLPLIFLAFSLQTTLADAGNEQPLPPDLDSIDVLDLETAQRIALAANPDLAAALSRVEQARARVSQAAAAWWPGIDLSGKYSRIRRSDTAYDLIKLYPSSPGVSSDRTYDEGSAALQATWVLFDGFFRTFKEEQARFNEKSLSAARRDSQRLLVNAVAEAFFNAQLAQTRVDIAAADQAFYQSQLKDATSRHQVGVGPWGDVLNIRVQLNNARTSLLLNQRQFEAAGYGLAALLGIADAALPADLRLAKLDSEMIIDDKVEKADELIRQALAIRPDIRRLEMQIKEARAGTGQARAAFYPRILVNGILNGSRQGDVHIGADDMGNSIGVSMAWNLFSGGADRARIFEAKQKEREARYSLMALRNQIAAEIRQELALLAAARDQVRLQRESVALVRENRDLAKSEYEAGETSLVRLNEAQRDLTTTYGRLAQALVAYQQARQRLLAATGQNLLPFASLVNNRATTAALGISGSASQSPAH